MSSEAVHDPRSRARVPPWRVRGWPVWQQPRSVLVVVLLVELAALGLAALALLAHRVTDREMGLTALIVGLQVVYVETVVRFTGRGRVPPRPRHCGLTSVAIVAGVLLLQPGSAVVVAVLVQAYDRQRIGPRPVAHQAMYSTSIVMLACLAAELVRVSLAADRAAPDLSVVLLTMAAYAAVNYGLMALVLWLARPRPRLVEVWGATDDNLLELAAIALGALAAAAIAISPLLTPLVLPAMLLLHRAPLVPHLEVEASVDGKTGLLNVTTWHERADQEMATPSDPPRAVLVIDLDHFKNVNDTFGHVAGDVVLAAVADAIQGSVRARDLVGRFGGEEFVVLVAPIDGGGYVEVEAVAQRIRRRVAELRVEVTTTGTAHVVTGLRVSIGAALQRPDGSPGGRGGLVDLLQLADTALYAAKRAGRDQVRVGELSADPA